VTRFRHAALAWKLFNLGFGPRMKLGVRATRIAGIPEELPADRPILLVSNHVSWWDGFILRGVQQVIRPGTPL
jgi:1-acyl-sn-glycerol-3-phosphate acyltransferase